MPIRNPAHKQPLKEQFDRPAMKLSDVVENIERSEERLMKNKISFEDYLESIPEHEWDHYKHAPVQLAELFWKAGQENV